MKSGLPVVLIWGNDFVARKLAKSFIGESVFVVARKEIIEENSDKNIGIIENINEVDFRIDYIFDFENDENAWSRAETDESRLVVIKRNKEEDTFEKLATRKADWRLICGFDVYGEGMEFDENWVARLVESAVQNRDLELPKDQGYLRCIEANDFCEVIKKTCFVPGISGEKLLIFGKKVSIDEICRTMISKAKMTKKGILIRDQIIIEVDDVLVKGFWDKIAWDGGESFEKRIEETLKYFFEKIDILSRDRKKKEIEVRVENKERSKKRLMEVEVESSEELEEELKKEEVIPVTEEVKVIEEKEMEEVNVKVMDEETKEVATKEEEEKIEKKTEKKEKKIEKIDEEMVEEDEEKIVGKEITMDKNLVWRPKLRPIEKIEEKEEQVETPIDLSQFTIKPAVKEKKEKIKIKERSEKKKFKINLAWLFLPIVMAVLIGVGVEAVFFREMYQVASSVEKSKALVEEKKIDELNKLADKNLAKIGKLSQQLEWVSLQGKLFSYKGFSEVLRVLEITWETEKEMVGFYDKAAKMGEAIFGEEDIDWKKTKGELVDKLEYLENKLGMIEARTSGDWSFLPGRFKSIVTDQTKEAKELRELATSMLNSLDTVYFLLGADGARRDYLLLFQNEMELRPNGGFIGSYGVLSVENGRFLKLDVGDIYDIDGQLKGHVEPPKPIKEILNEPSWYLRDANWQTDFATSAKDIEWFFKKETGRNIDGVIAINLEVAKALVKAVGEVYVTDFKEKVTAETLYDQAQFHSETGSFAGSRQKSMFLGKLASQLMEEIKDANDLKKIALVKGLLDSLDRNEMQIWVKDKNIRSELANLGWDGAMYSGGCGMENCLADYLYVVEANLGVNKSNYFLKRTMDVVVDISNRAVSRVLKINYENTARNTTWPGGDYKNYMRIYLPKDINIAEVVIYDSGDTKERKVLSASDMEISDKNDKKELAFLMTVPVTKKRTVEIRYASQIDLNLKSDFSYLNYMQRQSGYGDTPLTSLVSFPEGWNPIQVEPAATVVNGKLLFQLKFDRDEKMGVVVGK